MIRSTAVGCGTRRALKTLLGLAVLFSMSCQRGEDAYEATIRRTSYGVAHIEARDLGSLGYGEGYAFAEDHLCSLADQVLRARGERARYFGPGPGDKHLRSDIGHRALGIRERAERSAAESSLEFQQWTRGYVAGYNAYLNEVGVDSVPGWCRGMEWVKEITVSDLVAYHRAVTITGTNFVDMISTATPPLGSPAATTMAGGSAWGRSGVDAAEEVGLAALDRGSNGWAIGAERSASGGGMLVANPHYPWVGSNRFWEKHLIVPGELNVYGVGLLGIPGVSIGFNEAVAWTHTVSAGERFTLYSLDLVAGDPTRYLYDGEERAMTTKQVEVEVLQEDGSLQTVEHVIYVSHYGPILNFPGFGWNTERALTFRDANADNDEGRAQWLAMNRAQSLEEFQQAHAEIDGIPWVNTIAASADGRAWYADASATPHLSPSALEAWQERTRSDPATKAAFARGLVLLDGSDSLFEWIDDPEARDPGVVPFSQAPQLERSDYVFNANDSFWLANPHQLLTGYSPLHGSEATPRSLRTRMNAVLLADVSASGPAGEDGRFSLDELAAAVLTNRGLAAELLREPLVKRCQSTPGVDVDGTRVSLETACQVLARYDGRLDLDSSGAVLWREFMGQFQSSDLRRAGALFAQDFDPLDPVGTPRGLAPPGPKGDDVLTALGHAILVLEQAGIRLDAPLGEVQYSDRGGRRIPIHGGDGTFEGVTNFVRNRGNGTTLEPMPRPERVEGSRFLTVEGYPINSGSSFIMALDYASEGPQAVAFLTYGQSGDPTSEHFADQTLLFSEKQWRPILFTEEEIDSDPNLRVTTLKGSKQARPEAE